VSRCRGRTKSGKPCQRTVEAGETYCYQHSPGEATPSAASTGRKKGRLLAAAAATAATVAAVTLGVDRLKGRRKSSGKKKLFGKKRR